MGLSEEELIKRLMSWALKLEAGDLPPVPWKLNICSTVTGNEKFLKSLQRDIKKGPKGERARFGALQDDVINLWNLIGNK